MPTRRTVGVGSATVEVGAEHRVGLVERRAARRGRAQSVDEAVDVGDVAVHREHGVGDDERAPAVARSREQRVERVEVAVRVHRDLGPGEAGAVDDRRVVQLVGARRARPGPPNVVSTPRFAAKPVGNSTARLGALPRRELVLELAVHRPATRR